MILLSPFHEMVGRDTGSPTLSCLVKTSHTQALHGNGQIHVHLGYSPSSESSDGHLTLGRKDRAKDHH